MSDIFISTAQSFLQLFMPAMSIPPVVEAWPAKLAVILAGFAVMMGFSGLIVRRLCPLPPLQGLEEGLLVREQQLNTGAIVGKCENIIVMLLVLAGEATGIALIFAAKSIVRMEQIRKDPSYYLVGTMVNFTWSLIIGMVTRMIAFGF